MANVIEASVDERAGSVLLARVTGKNKLPITQDDISTVTYRVFLKDKPFTQVYPGSDATSLTPADVIFDELVTDDPRWAGVDNVGYNFAFELPAAAVPGSAGYRVEVKFVPVTGEVFFAKFDLKVRPTLTPTG